MKFFWEEDTVFLHLVKYFGKDSTNISRVILCGPYCPVAHLAPVSPTLGCDGTEKVHDHVAYRVHLIRSKIVIFGAKFDDQPRCYRNRHKRGQPSRPILLKYQTFSAL